jgi:type IV pilus assembly protein PilP
MAAIVLAASVTVWAQGAPAPQRGAAPPAAVPPAPGAQAPTAPAAAPAPEPYTYDPAGRRDPFVSLLSRGSEPAGGRKVTGLAGMATGDLMLRGILRSQGSYVALVAGPDGKTYRAQENDRLLDGVIRNVSPKGLVIMQEVNDPLSLVKQREVRKGLRAAEDGK